MNTTVNTLYISWSESGSFQSVLDQLESTAAVHVINDAMKSKYPKSKFCGFECWNLSPRAISDPTKRAEAELLKNEYLCHTKFFSDIIRTSYMFQREKSNLSVSNTSTIHQVLISIANEMNFRYVDALKICLNNYNNQQAVTAYVQKLIQMNTADQGAFFKLSSMVYGSNPIDIAAHCLHLCVALGFGQGNESMSFQQAQNMQHDAVEQSHDHVIGQMADPIQDPIFHEHPSNIFRYSFQDEANGLLQQFQDDALARTAAFKLDMTVQ